MNKNLKTEEKYKLILTQCSTIIKDMKNEMAQL